jgi:hypothetical protein
MAQPLIGSGAKSKRKINVLSFTVTEPIRRSEVWL